MLLVPLGRVVEEVEAAVKMIIWIAAVAWFCSRFGVAGISRQPRQMIII